MKIIALWNNYDTENGANSLPALCWLTDSCLLRESRPLYIPEFDSDFRLFPSVALRIDRLGKGIASRFASRYWHEVSAWLSVRACNLASRLIERGLPVDGAMAYDNSMVSAPFFALTASELPGLSFQVRVNGEPKFEWSANRMDKSVEQVIEQVSKNTTLKTGDVILPALPQEGIEIRRGDTVEIVLTGPPDVMGRISEPIINRFKVK